jgi:hypothetical protein
MPFDPVRDSAPVGIAAMIAFALESAVRGFDIRQQACPAPRFNMHSIGERDMVDIGQAHAAANEAEIPGTGNLRCR